MYMDLSVTTIHTYIVMTCPSLTEIAYLSCELFIITTDILQEHYRKNDERVSSFVSICYLLHKQESTKRQFPFTCVFKLYINTVIP